MPTRNESTDAQRRRRVFALSLLSGFFMGSPAAFASTGSPVGLWETVDDATGEATAVIRIALENGELIGTIEHLIREPGQDPNPPCTQCPGEKKGQRVEDLVMLWGFKKVDARWEGGFILDPDSGNTYRSELRVTDDDERLEVRGYIGIPLFGRSEVWRRKRETALGLSPSC